MEKKILLGLTTTLGSDWREKIKEIDELGLREIALFPTFLEIEERRQLYKLLEKTKLERIPHIHLRDDVQEWELDNNVNRFYSSVFNIHINKFTTKLLETKYKTDIYIETTDDINDFFIENINKCGGICLDAAHCEDRGSRKYLSGYEKIPELLEKYKIGCAHISAIKDKPTVWKHYITGKEIPYWSSHWLENLSELDYVKKYVKYLPEYVSIELENPFKKQLEVRAYLENIINQKSND
jgi:sugar phosphate isomerase/epimerase